MLLSGADPQAFATDPHPPTDGPTVQAGSVPPPPPKIPGFKDFKQFSEWTNELVTTVLQKEAIEKKNLKAHLTTLNKANAVLEARCEQLAEDNRVLRLQKTSADVLYAVLALLVVALGGIVFILMKLYRPRSHNREAIDATVKDVWDRVSIQSSDLRVLKSTVEQNQQALLGFFGQWTDYFRRYETAQPDTAPGPPPQVAEVPPSLPDKPQTCATQGLARAKPNALEVISDVYVRHCRRGPLLDRIDVFQAELKKEFGGTSVEVCLVYRDGNRSSNSRRFFEAANSARTPVHYWRVTCEGKSYLLPEPKSATVFADRDLDTVFAGPRDGPRVTPSNIARIQPALLDRNKSGEWEAGPCTFELRKDEATAQAQVPQPENAKPPEVIAAAQQPDGHTSTAPPAQQPQGPACLPVPLGDARRQEAGCSVAGQGRLEQAAGPIRVLPPTWGALEEVLEDPVKAVCGVYVKFCQSQSRIMADSGPETLQVLLNPSIPDSGRIKIIHTTIVRDSSAFKVTKAGERPAEFWVLTVENVSLLLPIPQRPSGAFVEATMRAYTTESGLLLSARELSGIEPATVEPQQYIYVLQKKGVLRFGQVALQSAPPTPAPNMQPGPEADGTKPMPLIGVQQTPMPPPDTPEKPAKAQRVREWSSAALGRIFVEFCQNTPNGSRDDFQVALDGAFGKEEMEVVEAGRPSEKEPSVSSPSPSGITGWVVIYHLKPFLVPAVKNPQQFHDMGFFGGKEVRPKELKGALPAELELEETEPSGKRRWKVVTYGKVQTEVTDR